MSINLRQMEVFRAVMQSGGVNSAAQLLHVSPPAISKVLAQAAKASELVLFERVKGRLIPTPEAQRLFEEIERLWDGVERVRELGVELALGRESTLRLVCTASLAPYLVSRTMARMYDDFPHLKCQLQVLGPDVINEALLNRSMNLAIALGPQEHPNLAAVRTYACGLACVMRNDHPLSTVRLVRPANLEGLRVIASPQSTTFGQTLRRAFGASAARMHIDFECISSTTACWFAQAGVGVAVVDQAAIAGGLLAGLAVRPFQSDERLSVGILRNRYRPMSVVERAFVTRFDETWQTMDRPRRARA